jgi:hypothetical protein
LEDDGQTGYFYALDRSFDKTPIRDALHVGRLPEFPTPYRSSQRAETILAVVKNNGRISAAIEQGTRDGDRISPSGWDWETPIAHIQQRLPPLRTSFLDSGCRPLGQDAPDSGKISAQCRCVDPSARNLLDQISLSNSGSRRFVASIAVS